MANPLDTLLGRTFGVPPLDETLPAFLELSDGSFVPIERASKPQVRQAAKMHREISRRHEIQAAKLEAYVGR